MPGMVSQTVLPPSAMTSSGPHSLPAQTLPRLPVQAQQGQPGLLNVQPNQPRTIPNQPIPQIHPHHIPQGYQGKLLFAAICTP